MSRRHFPHSRYTTSVTLVIGSVHRVLTFTMRVTAQTRRDLWRAVHAQRPRRDEAHPESRRARALRWYLPSGTEISNATREDVLRGLRTGVWTATGGPPFVVR